MKNYFYSALLFFALILLIGGAWAIYAGDPPGENVLSGRYVDPGDAREVEPGRYVDNLSYDNDLKSINNVLPTTQNIQLENTDGNIQIIEDPANSRIIINFIGDYNRADSNIINTLKTWGRILTDNGTYPEPNAYYWDLNLHSKDKTITVTGNAPQDYIDLSCNVSGITDTNAGTECPPGKVLMGDHKCYDYNAAVVLGRNTDELHSHSYLKSKNAGTLLTLSDEGGISQLLEGHNNNDLNINSKKDLTLSADRNYIKILEKTTIGGYKNPADVLHVYVSGDPYAVDIIGSAGQTIQHSQTNLFGAHLRLIGGDDGINTYYSGTETDYTDFSISHSNILGDVTHRAKSGDMEFYLDKNTNKEFFMQNKTTSTVGQSYTLRLNRDTTGSPAPGFGTGIRLEANGTHTGDLYSRIGTAATDGDMILNVFDGGAAYNVLGVFGGERSVGISHQGSTGLSKTSGVLNVHSNTSGALYPVGRFHQDNTAGVDACINLDQDDTDEPYIDFDGSNVLAVPEPVEYLRVEYNGQDYAIALYEIETHP